MGSPTFKLALLWDNTSSSAAIKPLIESLESHFPTSKVSNVAVTLSQAMACLHFSVDFSLYAKKTLSQVDSEVKASGGQFVELLRIPEDKREAFKAKFLLPARGAPSTFNSLKDCPRPIQEHLTKLARGIRDEPLAEPTAPAAPPRPRPNRRRAPRFTCNLDVEFQTEKGFVHEHATNISKGGIFVCTSQRPTPNSQLCLKIQLPNRNLLETTARVLYVLEQPAPGGVGLAFSNDDAVFASQVERYFSPIQKK
jgi:uncharacterized protein (TIGR02266 family)